MPLESSPAGGVRFPPPPAPSINGVTKISNSFSNSLSRLVSITTHLYAYVRPTSASLGNETDNVATPL